MAACRADRHPLNRAPAGIVSQSLRGRNIVVTRPAAQAGALLHALSEAGANAIAYPLLEIEPASPDAVLALADPALPGAALAVFVSPNAVRHGLAPLLAAGSWPAGIAAAAVGQGTARALAAAGIDDVRVPATGFDSEALLALPDFSSRRIGGQTIVLFKGEGGRPLLAETLAARGARVVSIDCYRRRPPSQPPTELFGLADRGQIDAIVVTSSEALDHLHRLFDPARRGALLGTLLAATHGRIGEAAQSLGFRRILVTDPGDAAVLAALRSYNWPPPPPSPP